MFLRIETRDNEIQLINTRFIKGLRNSSENDEFLFNIFYYKEDFIGVKILSSSGKPIKNILTILDILNEAK